MDLGSSKRYRRQITSLLTDLDKANHTSYEQQIEASAERIATATGERMRGLIRSGIISPVTGAVVTYAANEMFDWVNTELFGRRELDKLKAMADSLQLGGGVSAGENDGGENYGSDGKQELDKTFLSYRADDVIEFIEKYQNFAKEYPTLAEYGLQALSLGLKGVYTLATGGTGLFAIAANEAKGMLVSAVTADAMQKVVDISIEKTQKQLLEYDNTLTDQQAQALASALVVGTALTFSSVQDVRSYASVIKNIGKPKVTNANPLHLESSKLEAEKTSITSKKGVENEVITKKTAIEVVAENPYVTRQYIREMESITGEKIDPKQLTKLKEALQKTEFKKLSKEVKDEHRNNFDNIKNKLIDEWERNTGQKWPVYESHPDPKRVGKRYDAHHIIQVDHGGSNEWWNMFPAHGLTEHTKIHSKDSTANVIFKPKD